MTDHGHLIISLRILTMNQTSRSIQLIQTFSAAVTIRTLSLGHLVKHNIIDWSVGWFLLKQSTASNYSKMVSGRFNFLLL